MILPSTAIETMVRMMEALPEATQEQVVEHLREYLEELQDEIRWDTTFQKTQARLVEAVRRAKAQIAAGQAEPMHLDELW